MMPETEPDSRALILARLAALDAPEQLSELPRANGSATRSTQVGQHHAPVLRTLHLTRASTIKPRPVRWLWALRMALGTLVLVGGREGIGKSICVYTLLAMLTKGLLDGVYGGTPKAVIVAATEDSWEHTIVPRLMAAGADLQMVYRVDVATSDAVETSLCLPRDLIQLERVTREVGAVAIVLDPLMSRLDAKLDTHKDAEVRLALEPLVALADRTGATIIGLIHVNKSTSSDPLTMLMASRAFAAVARAVLFVMQDPHDEQLRLLGQAKNNLGQTDLPTLGFRIAGHKVAETAEGPVWTGRLEWTGTSARTIREALEETAQGAGDRTATSEAMDWLGDFIEQHDGSADSAAIKKDGARAGHSISALQRARKRLGLTTVTSGFPRRTFWARSSQSFQSQSFQSGESETTEMNETNGENERQSSQSSQSAKAVKQLERSDGASF